MNYKGKLTKQSAIKLGREISNIFEQYGPQSFCGSDERDIETSYHRAVRHILAEIVLYMHEKEVEIECSSP